MSLTYESVPRRCSVIWLLTISMIVINACTFNASTHDPISGELYIASIGPGEIRSNYTELFQVMYPDIDIEIIDLYDVRNSWLGYDDWGDVINQLSEAPPFPDIVISDEDQHQKLVQEGMLMSLESIWQQSELDEELMVPVVLEYLKNIGDGQLHGLTPTFTGQALVYNKDLFAETGVSEPTDGMTWDEIIMLAKRITATDQDDRVKGLAFNPYSGGAMRGPIYEYFDLQGLKIVSTTEQEMMVDTDLWKEQWHVFVDLSRAGVLHRPVGITENVDWEVVHNFFSGNIAMSVIYSSQLSSMILNIEENPSTDESFNWDVVTMPVVVSAPDTGGSISAENIFSIHANAENVDHAYKFIEFIHSEEWARLQPRGGELLTFESYNAPQPNFDYDPSVFYRLKPQDLSHHELDLTEIKEVGYELFLEVLKGDKGVNDALTEWQHEGDILLQQMND